MMRIIKHFLLIGAMLYTNNILACSLKSETSYLVDIENFVFVMITGSDITAFEEFISDSGMIYGLSGLYKNDGNYNNPEWTVDWYDRSANFFIDNNGSTLIKIIKTSSSDKVALAFYDRGVLTKEYKVKELIRDVDNITHELDFCLGGKWAKQANVNKNNSIVIETRNNEYYVFNTVTGEILESIFDPNDETIAKVKLINNENILLTNFKACDGFATVQLLQGDNDSINGVYGYTHKENGQSHQDMTVYIVPFAEIDYVSRRTEGDEKLSWDIHMKNGDTSSILIDEGTNYCGKTKSDEAINLLPNEIARIDFQ